MAGTMKYFYMRMNSIPQKKEILLFCHPTWLPSRDHTKLTSIENRFLDVDLKFNDTRLGLQP
jgi:hypothetical protein